MTALLVPGTPEPRNIPRLVPGSEAWLRQPYVSASTAGVLFGVDRYKTIQQLAAMKRGEWVDEAGEAAETGSDFEAPMAEWWAKQHGVTVYEPVETCVNGPISANVDRRILGSETDILEVKCSSHAEGSMPSSHWWQAQALLWCTGAERCHFAYLWGGSLTRRKPIVGRDEEAIAELVRRADVFLAAVEMGADPPVVDRDPTEQTIALAAREADLLAEWKALRATRLEVEKDEDRLRRELLALVGAGGMAVGSRAQVTVDGAPVARVRVQQGRPRQVADPSGERGEPIAVLEAL